ncbi:MAG: replication initiator protein A [Planctomycetaceae bacterium]|nr:replication initiator protein A [Planctomycetaceae bacterium]
MSDEDKDARRVGRDEMNLSEYPVTLLTERVPPGCKTITFRDRHGTLTVTGSDDYGLPAAGDSDVIVALLHLTKSRNDFTAPTVLFTRYEVLKLLGWEDKGGNYHRLDESLRRWVGVTLRYDGNWWDNDVRCRIDASFHILDDVTLFDQEVRRTLRTQQQPLPLSSFTWGRKFFESCRAGNLKALDLGVYFSLRSAVSKQMYRFLDKRFYVRHDWTFDLREFALEHIGLARTYDDAGKLKAKLQPALEELEAIGFLEPMSPAARYSKTGRGAWNIRLVRKLPAPVEAKPAKTKPPEPEPTGLEKELVERGVTRGVAAELVRDFPEDRIRRQVEVVDWLRETKPKRVKDLGAYLARAIREDYAAPAGFESKAARAARETAARAAHDREVEARQSRARAQEERDRVQAYWEALPPERRAALDAEALAGADPADRAAYAAATAPPVRRMLQAGLRDAHLRRLLGLPAAD